MPQLRAACEMKALDKVYLGSEFKLAVLSFVDVSSNCTPTRMSTSPLALYNLLFVVTLE